MTIFTAGWQWGRWCIAWVCRPSTAVDTRVWQLQWIWNRWRRVDFV